MANIADLVRQLQSEIKKQYGVTTKIEIIAFPSDNGNVLDRDMANIFVHKIAKQFVNSKISHKKGGSSFWVNIDFPYNERLEITAFYNMEIDPEDIDEPEQQYEDEGEC